MDNTMPIVRGLVIALITCGLGLCTIRRGWRMLRTPGDVAPDLLRLVAIVLVRIVQGDAVAMRKRAELMKPDRIRRSGRYVLIAGALLLGGGCLQLVGWISKIIGL
jgi:hypothetical protein